MILGDHALGHGGRHKGEPVTIDHGLQQVGIPQTHRRRAQDRHRLPGGTQDLGRPPHGGLRCRAEPSPRWNRRHVLGGRSQRDILGEVQMNGPQGLAQGDLERLGQHRGHLALSQGKGRLRDRPEERVMVDRHLDAPAELRRGQITRDRQERRTIEIGIAHTGRQVGGAGSQCRNAESRRARHSPHDVGRERRRALVGREHVRQPADPHGFEQGKHVPAGDSKAVAHARRPQCLHDELGVVHGGRPGLSTRRTCAGPRSRRPCE